MNSTETRVHHPYSPSTLQSLEACPCYVGYNDVVHERAIAGTLAHEVTESREDNQRLSDEDSEAAAECLDFYDGRVRLFHEERQLALIGNPYPESVEEVIELREVYLPIDDCVFADANATTAGYVDRAVISHDRVYAELFDWKFGFWPVEKAENNLQGISYALGLFKKYPRLLRVRFFFKLPHQHMLTEAMFTRAQVPELYLRVQAVVARARAARQSGDFATANPMIPACNFCANIGKCPRVLEFACKVGSKFYPIEIPEHITPTMAQDKHNTKLMLRLCAVLKIWSESAKRQTTDRILRGDADLPDGFVIASKTPRKLVNNKLYREITERFLTAEELRPLDADNPLTFTAIESAINDKSPRGQKKATIERFRNSLESEGAVRDGDSYTFLRSVAERETDEQATT